MLYKKLQLLRKLSHLLANQDKQVVYIAGKVSNLELSYVQAKFALSQGKLEADGFTVLNPMQLVNSHGDWQFDMRMCMPLVGMADVIYLQSDWVDSEGAKLEFELATAIGLHVIFEGDGTEHINHG